MRTSKLSDHSLRERFLEDLATLSGFTVRTRCLPDGVLPDVLRFEPGGRGLFLGDAKDTETPGNRETLVRLYRYVQWFDEFLQRPGTYGVFAVCFGKRSQSADWDSSLEFLFREAGMSCHVIGFKQDFGKGLQVVARIPVYSPKGLGA